MFLLYNLLFNKIFFVKNCYISTSTFKNLTIRFNSQEPSLSHNKSLIFNFFVKANKFAENPRNSQIITTLLPRTHDEMTIPPSITSLANWPNTWASSDRIKLKPSSPLRRRWPWLLHTLTHTHYYIYTGTSRVYARPAATLQSVCPCQLSASPAAAEPRGTASSIRNSSSCPPVWK